MMLRYTLRVGPAGLALLLVLGLVGCGGGAYRSGSATLAATGSAHRLDAKIGTCVYAAAFDTSAVDFYLSDLPPEVWRQGGDVSAHAGNLIHIHMFVAPKAGATPIEKSASSATVRWLVLSRGRVGVYGGGGFFNKSGEVGDESLSGHIDNASLRLLHASPGFEDRLGPSSLSASFDAKNDAAEAAIMARALAALVAQATPTPKP